MKFERPNASVLDSQLNMQAELDAAYQERANNGGKS